MESVKFAAVLLLVSLVQTVSALGAPLSAEDEDNEGQMWTVDKWQGNPVERGLTIRLADLIKRSKAQQFHGLMGRSQGVLARLGRKQHYPSLQGLSVNYAGTDGVNPIFELSISINGEHMPVIGNNNNKGEMFVGLMGRSLGEDEEEWKPDNF